ncbi:MAG: FAD-dependent monooxygenase [Hyphomicrobiales bacterium]|nr:FAD-dependent monooxygenase [Hyphomicrobiales bacterium]
MNRKTQIAVVGAGLGGLTVAGFLQRAGFPVMVYEQAPTFSRIGAGIILSANAMKVLRRLGVEDELVRTGIKPQCYVSRAWDTGATMYEIYFDAASEKRFGGPYINIHRGDLHDVLAQAVAPKTIAFDHQLVDVKKSQGRYLLSFRNGGTAQADIVIGADGIRSKVREIFIDDRPPRFIGAVAHRAIFSAERLGGFKIPDCTKWWGRDRHSLPYYMTGRRDELYVIGVVPAREWDSEAVSLPGSREAMMADFADFHPDYQRVLRAVGTVTVWPIFDRARDDRWSGDRVVLMGDACHPMRPFMAAGGAMAIEDGAVLSRCIVHFDDPAEAFACYAATRIPRVADVQRISLENSWMRGPTDTDWFYCYDACTAELAHPSPSALPLAGEAKAGGLGTAESH